LNFLVSLSPILFIPKNLGIDIFLSKLVEFTNTHAYQICLSKGGVVESKKSLKVLFSKKILDFNLIQLVELGCLTVQQVCLLTGDWDE